METPCQKIQKQIQVRIIHWFENMRSFFFCYFKGEQVTPKYKAITSQWLLRSEVTHRRVPLAVCPQSSSTRRLSLPARQLDKLPFLNGIKSMDKNGTIIHDTIWLSIHDKLNWFPMIITIITKSVSPIKPRLRFCSNVSSCKKSSPQQSSLTSLRKFYGFSKANAPCCNGASRWVPAISWMMSWMMSWPSSRPVPGYPRMIFFRSQSFFKTDEW